MKRLLVRLAKCAANWHQVGERQLGTWAFVPVSTTIIIRKQLLNCVAIEDTMSSIAYSSSWVGVKLMNMWRSFVFLPGHLAVIVAANIATSTSVFSQSSVNITTNAEGGQVQSTTVSVDRADLTQPHVLRVQGSANDTLVRLRRVEVKANAKLVRSIVNNSLELNLAPLLKVGRNEIDISGTAPQPENTISVNFTGPNTKVSQQFSGNSTVKQTLVINVR
jgi:hypothetical protein